MAKLRWRSLRKLSEDIRAKHGSVVRLRKESRRLAEHALLEALDYGDDLRQARRETRRVADHTDSSQATANSHF